MSVGGTFLFCPLSKHLAWSFRRGQGARQVTGDRTASRPDREPMFESFYTSFWQHPLLLWVFPVIFWARARPSGTYFERAVVVFLALTILDPLMTGPVPSLFAWPAEVANGVMLFFVLLGDFRFFFFVERFSCPDRGAPQSYVVAVAVTFVVPLLQAGLIALFPSAFENSRHTFLAYELLFLVLALVYRFAVLPRRNLTSETRKWMNAITAYAMLYYGLWATADMMILAGSDLGFLLRVLPNVLYYGAFLPFVYVTAPVSLKAPLPFKPAVSFKRRGEEPGGEG